MSRKVLSSDSCDCDCSGTGLSLAPAVSGAGIIVRSKPGIDIGNVINEYQENGQTVYELDDLVEVFPAIAFSNDADVTEVGVNIATVIFSGSITAGTYPIATREISPDPGGLNLAAPFTFNKTNVKRTSPGVAQLHTVTATDDQGNTTNRASGVDFKYAFYRGYSELVSLTQAQIKALVAKTLNDAVLDEYGGVAKSYTVPASPNIARYIYWAGPVGTTPIQQAVLNGLTLPLTVLPTVNVTNANDVTIITPYWVVRTSNKLDPATYLITAL